MTLLFNLSLIYLQEGSEVVNTYSLFPFGELQSSARYEFTFNILHLGILVISNVLNRLFLIKYEPLKSVYEKQQLNHVFLYLKIHSRKINFDISNFENRREQRNCYPTPS